MSEFFKKKQIFAFARFEISAWALPCIFVYENGRSSEENRGTAVFKQPAEPVFWKQELETRQQGGQIQNNGIAKSDIRNAAGGAPAPDSQLGTATEK